MLIELISGSSTTTDLIIIMLSQQMKEKHFLKGLNNSI
jgi:hypothetical protein